MADTPIRKDGYSFAEMHDELDEKRKADAGFVTDSKVKDAIVKSLQIAANDLIMKTIIPAMKKTEDTLMKEHNLTKDSTMNVKGYGTAMLHDVFREIIGQGLTSMGNLKKRI
jgi:hypothetical protein